MKTHHTIWCTLICSLLTIPLIEELRAEPDNNDDSGYLTLYLDNDLFSGTDENYTNGLRISYITEGKPVIDIPFVQNFLTRFSAEEDSESWVKKIWGYPDSEEAEYSYGFALTQLMYTPVTFDTPEPLPGERPYAGWLGVGVSIHVRDANVLNSVELSIGTVGDHALAEITQDFIHDARGFDRFQGWDSQVPNEPTLNLHFNQRRRGKLFSEIEMPFDLEIDGFVENGYAVGNFLTSAHVGGIMRVGWNLPIEFSDPRLGLTAHSQRLFSQEATNRHDWSFYGLIGVKGSAILHDISLDGPVFRSYEPSVDKEPLVGEYFVGFGLRYQDWEYAYVHTFRSRQFETQDGSQSFGSVAIRKRF